MYRVTGAHRAVCGVVDGGLMELACDAPVPHALYGASPLCPLAACVTRWLPMSGRVEALCALDAA